ncbi:hypothetical protein EJ04DRAFT_410594, partial [Polyplosphaeria fusca]
KLSNVAFVPRFFTNAVSLSRCIGAGIHFDSGRHYLYQERPSNVISQLEFNGGHWLFDSCPGDRPSTDEVAAFAVRMRRSEAQRQRLRVSKEDAHRIFAHASPEAIKHLPEAVEGLELVLGTSSPSGRQCPTCIESKLSNIVSRRQPSNPSRRPFYRVSLDIVQLLHERATTLGGEKYLLHFVCEYTGWHKGVCIPDRKASTITLAFKRYVNKVLRTY